MKCFRAGTIAGAIVILEFLCSQVMAEEKAISKSIQPPHQTGECVRIGGILVCPFIVYLTDEQLKTVQDFHGQNLNSLQNIKSAPK